MPALWQVAPKLWRNGAARLGELEGPGRQCVSVRTSKAPLAAPRALVRPDMSEGLGRKMPTLGGVPRLWFGGSGNYIGRVSGPGWAGEEWMLGQIGGRGWCSRTAAGLERIDSPGSVGPPAARKNYDLGSVSRRFATRAHRPRAPETSAPCCRIEYQYT